MGYLRRGKECIRHQCLNFTVSSTFCSRFLLCRQWVSSVYIFIISVSAHELNMASCWSEFAGESFSLPVHLSISGGSGGGAYAVSV